MSSRRLFYDFNFAKFTSMVEVNEIAKVVNELYNVRWMLLENYEAKFCLENNTISLERRKKLLLKFLDMMISRNVSPYTITILFYLLEKKVFNFLGYFINVLKYTLAEDYGLMLVEVISRYHIGEDTLIVYKTSLEYIYKKRVEFVFKRVPSLLGGFKLRWHRGEIDMTIHRKLKQVQNAIIKGHI